MTDKLRYVSEEDIWRELWLRGDLRYRLLPDGQTRAYDFITETHIRNPMSRRPSVIVTHRGAGKSFLLVVLGLERCLKSPGHIARFGAPTFKQAVGILDESLPKILQHCPSDIVLYPTEERLEIRKHPRWPPGAPKSVLWKFGANRDTIDSQRGLRAHTLLLDEVRNWDSLDYALNEVLSFQTARMDNPLVLITTTPPKSTGHYFWSQIAIDAQKENRYFELPITENTDVSDEEKDELARGCGGYHTIAWRREALCERISDPFELVVPEFTKVEKRIVREWEKPDFCYQGLGADSGFSDAFAVLFWYADFLAQKIVIERELVKAYQSTKEIADAIKAIEEELYSRRPLRHNVRRVADAPKQRLWDLQQDHQLLFREAEKHDRDSSLAALRAALMEERIIISPECKNTIYQLRDGVWRTNKDGKKIEFQRHRDSDKDVQLGHLDCVAALTYLWRAFRTTLQLNPFPPQAFNERDMHIGPGFRHEKPVNITGVPLKITHNPI